MRTNERIFLVLTIIMALILTANMFISLSTGAPAAASKIMGPANKKQIQQGQVPPGTPRQADLPRIRQMIRDGQLSDREADFYDR
jgi:hypothetical protein